MAQKAYHFTNGTFFHATKPPTETWPGNLVKWHARTEQSPCRVDTDGYHTCPALLYMPSGFPSAPSASMLCRSIVVDRRGNVVAMTPYLMMYLVRAHTAAHPDEAIPPTGHWRGRASRYPCTPETTPVSAQAAGEFTPVVANSERCVYKHHRGPRGQPVAPESARLYGRPVCCQCHAAYLAPRFKSNWIQVASTATSVAFGKTLQQFCRTLHWPSFLVGAVVASALGHARLPCSADVIDLGRAWLCNPVYEFARHWHTLRLSGDTVKYLSSMLPGNGISLVMIPRLQKVDKRWQLERAHGLGPDNLATLACNGVVFISTRRTHCAACISASVNYRLDRDDDNPVRSSLMVTLKPSKATQHVIIMLSAFVDCIHHLTAPACPRVRVHLGAQTPVRATYDCNMPMSHCLRPHGAIIVSNASRMTWHVLAALFTYGAPLEIYADALLPRGVVPILVELSHSGLLEVVRAPDPLTESSCRKRKHAQEWSGHEAAIIPSSLNTAIHTRITSASHGVTARPVAC